MKGGTEAAVFFGIAAAAHVAVAAAVTLPGSLPEGAGEDGRNSVTLAAMPDLSGVIADWETPPQVEMMSSALTAPDVAPPVSPVNAQSEPVRVAAAPRISDAAPDTSTAPTIPTAPIRTATPDIAAPMPPRDTPLADASPRLAALKTLNTPQLVDRPILDQAARPGAAPPTPENPAPPLPKRAKQSPESRPALRASGAGKSARAGSSAKPKVSQETAPAPARAAVDPSKLAKWGSRIRSRIEARKRTPPGIWPRSRAVVRIRVAPDGRVVQAFIVRATGDPRLDRAAMDAVRRAGRLPRAPRGLPNTAQIFDVPMTFSR